MKNKEDYFDLDKLEEDDKKPKIIQTEKKKFQRGIYRQRVIQTIQLLTRGFQRYQILEIVNKDRFDERGELVQKGWNITASGLDEYLMVARQEMRISSDLEIEDVKALFIQRFEDLINIGYRNQDYAFVKTVCDSAIKLRLPELSARANTVNLSYAEGKSMTDEQFEELKNKALGAIREERQEDELEILDETKTN